MSIGITNWRDSRVTAFKAIHFGPCSFIVQTVKLYCSCIHNRYRLEDIMFLEICLRLLFANAMMAISSTCRDHDFWKLISRRIELSLSHRRLLNNSSFFFGGGGGRGGRGVLVQLKWKKKTKSDRDFTVCYQSNNWNEFFQLEMFSSWMKLQPTRNHHLNVRLSFLFMINNKTKQNKTKQKHKIPKMS